MVLLGPVAAGKTAVGTLLAGLLGRPWRDSDEELARRYGTTSQALAERRGVDGLHQLELAVFVAAMDAAPPAVVAPAASVIDDAAGRRRLAGDDAWCVLLDADADTIAARLRDDDHRRPFGPGVLQRLLDERRPLWRAVADVRLRTDTRAPADIAADVTARFRRVHHP